MIENRWPTTDTQPKTPKHSTVSLAQWSVIFVLSLDGMHFSFHLEIYRETTTMCFFFVLLSFVFFFIRWDIASSQTPPNQPYFSPQAFIFRFLRGFTFSHLYRKYTERFIFICLCFLNGSDWLVSGTLTCWGDFKQQPLNQPVRSSRVERKEMHVRMKSFLIYLSE